MKVPTEEEMQAMHERLEIRGSSLWWKVRGSGRTDMYKPAGRMSNSGYMELSITGGKSKRFWFAHRVVWFLHTGAWPTTIIDHRDGNKTNNDPENLRPATKKLNAQNAKAHIDNSLGIKGVYKKRKGFSAQLSVGAKRYAKYCPTLEEAVAHRKYLEEKYHPFSPNQQTVV